MQFALVKTKWEGQFFEKNLRIQFNVGFDYESNGGFFDYLFFHYAKNPKNKHNLSLFFGNANFMHSGSKKFNEII